MHSGGTGDVQKAFQSTANTVSVHAHVEGADRLSHLDLKLDALSPRLHISHHWTEAHRVISRKVHSDPHLSANFLNTLPANKYNIKHI